MSQEAGPEFGALGGAGAPQLFHDACQQFAALLFVDRTQARPGAEGRRAVEGRLPGSGPAAPGRQQLACGCRQ